MSFIPYGRQSISGEDIEAVVEVLRSDWLTQGPAVSQFETTVADYVGAKNAVAVSNGTAALHLACLAMGLGYGDWLWTSPNTFVASANCGLYCGAQVDFVDIDPITWNMDAAALEVKLRQAEAEGRLPKIVVPVDFAGQSCDMQPIRKLADKYGFKILEDASHAIGGSYKGSHVGSCRYSDATVFSFHPVKVVTTGEGGMVVTNNCELAEKIRTFRAHGITRNPQEMTHEVDGPWYYEQLSLGFNYRITDLQCALGISQMKQLESFVERRSQLAQRYFELLSDLPLTLPSVLDSVYSAWHLFVILLDDCGIRRDVFERMRLSNIGVNVHYIPVHTQPWYRKMGFDLGDFPVAENYYRRAISLPMYPALKEWEQEKIVDELKVALENIMSPADD